MIFDIFTTLLIATNFVNSLQKENVLERRLKPRVSGNEIFDTIMQNIMSDGIVKEKFTEVPIRNLETDLKTKWFVVQVRASLEATGGVISGLTSLHRISDVTYRTVGNTTYFTAGVTLHNLQLTFNYYHLRFGVFFKTGDRLTLNVGTKSFIATLKSHVDGSHCELTLDDLEVSELSDIKVELSGLYFIGHIVSWFHDYLYNVINEITVKNCKYMVKYVIEKKRVCEELFEDEIVHHGRPTLSFVEIKPSHRIETLSKNPAHDEVTNLTILSLTVPKSEGSSKKPHRITKDDDKTTPFLKTGVPTSTPQVSSRITKIENDDKTTPFLKIEVPTSIPQVSSRITKNENGNKTTPILKIEVPTSTPQVSSRITKNENSNKITPILKIEVPTSTPQVSSRITKNENDDKTTPFLKIEVPTSTPQVSSQHIPSKDPSADILEMIDDIPSMGDR